MYDKHAARMPERSLTTIQVPTHSCSSSTPQYASVTLPNPPWAQPSDTSPATGTDATQGTGGHDGP